MGTSIVDMGYQPGASLSAQALVVPVSNPPLSSQGQDGDYGLDPSGGLWGPKAAGAWPGSSLALGGGGSASAPLCRIYTSTTQAVAISTTTVVTMASTHVNDDATYYTANVSGHANTIQLLKAGLYSIIVHESFTAATAAVSLDALIQVGIGGAGAVTVAESSIPANSAGTGRITASTFYRVTSANATSGVYVNAACYLGSAATLSGATFKDVALEIAYLGA